MSCYEYTSYLLCIKTLEDVISEGKIPRTKISDGLSTNKLEKEKKTYLNIIEILGNNTTDTDSMLSSSSASTSASYYLCQVTEEIINNKKQKKMINEDQGITSIVFDTIKNDSDTDSASTCSVTSASSTVITSSSSSSSESNIYSENNTYFEYFFSSTGSDSFRHTSISNNIHDSEQHSIFCEPFFVCSKPETNNRGNNAVTIYEGLISIMIYNLALSYHLKAIELDSQLKNMILKSHMANLQKALSLYTISNNMITNNNISGNMVLLINSASNVIYKMAFTYNLEHLRHVFGETNKRRMSCTQFLLDSLTEHYKSALI